MIPNPSFEVFDSCPGDGLIIHADFWFQPSVANGNVINSCSSDYFHACSTNSNNVPNTWAGFQNALSGNGYAGITLENQNGNYREYLEVKLIDSLKTNEVFCISAFTSLAEMSNHYIGNFEVNFSTDSILESSYSYISVVSKLSLSDEKISDKTNWIKIFNFYRANGGEKFMTFGNFSSPSQTDVDTNGTGTLSISYYYFDDFSLEKIDTTDIHAGKDTAICIGQSLTLGEDTALEAVYHWEPGYGLSDTSAMNPVASPTTTTTYILKKTVCKYTMTDTVTVTVGCIGIDENKKSKIVSVLPNPSTGQFLIRGFELSGKMYCITDIYGKEIMREVFTSEETSINLQSFENGIYFLKLAKENSVIKLVKQ